MALVVEDGTGLDDAQSYCSVADADIWHAARGAAAWDALTTDQKEVNLFNATRYMLDNFRLRWAGQRMLATQALDWPRCYVPMRDVLDGEFYDDDVVPNEVRDACAELALKAQTQDLSPDIKRLRSRERVEGAIDITYAPNGVPYVRFRTIENMVMIFFRAMSNSVIR